MTLREQLDAAIAEEARLLEERKAAYDRDPGNTGIVHNIQQAWGYHHAFNAWNEARQKRVALEFKWAMSEEAP
jgi:hypothetical protein